MSMTERLKGKAKAVTTSAVGAFVLANPLISTFLLGAGVAVYFVLRSKR